MTEISRINIPNFNWLHDDDDIQRSLSSFITVAMTCEVSGVCIMSINQGVSLLVCVQTFRNFVGSFVMNPRTHPVSHAIAVACLDNDVVQESITFSVDAVRAAFSLPQCETPFRDTFAAVSTAIIKHLPDPGRWMCVFVLCSQSQRS